MRGACIDPAGYDAGKKIMGKKRHILVDTQGLLMQAIVHAADIQDRDGGAVLMATLFGAFPFLTRLFADGGYRGAQFQRAIGRTLAQVTVEIVKRSDHAKDFVVLPKRWIVDHRTMLPVWVSNGPHLLNVRAVGDRLLFPGSSGEQVDLSQANQSRHKF